MKAAFYFTWEDWAIGIGVNKPSYPPYKIAINLDIGPVLFVLYLFKKKGEL